MDPAKLAAIYHAWRDHSEGSDTVSAIAVPVLDLLGPEATLLPARWLKPVDQETDAADVVAAVRKTTVFTDEALARLAAVSALHPERLHPREPRLRRASIADLIDDGVVVVLSRGRLRKSENDLGDEGIPVVTGADVRHPGRRPVRHLAHVGEVPDALTKPGDVLVVLC
jgi:hypothetical protein